MPDTGRRAELRWSRQFPDDATGLSHTQLACVEYHDALRCHHDVQRSAIEEYQAVAGDALTEGRV